MSFAVLSGRKALGYLKDMDGYLGAIYIDRPSDDFTLNILQLPKDITIYVQLSEYYIRFLSGILEFDDESQICFFEVNDNGVKFLQGSANEFEFSRIRRRQAIKRDLDWMVVGPPRSGFTLLISILNNLVQAVDKGPNRFQNRLRQLIHESSVRFHEAVVSYFKNHINIDDLIISGEFQLLVGGPKWINKGDRRQASFRKYVGIKGKGDFLLVFHLPKEVMEYYDVIHSHYEPAWWPDDSDYNHYLKFATIRNPIDIINSSVFSINALTSEYIRRYVNEDQYAIRDRLALYKLTDLNFIEGLISYLLDYLRDFHNVKDRYHIMKWEDLITNPIETIQWAARIADVSISPERAVEIWGSLNQRNLTLHHQHNFRKGIIGDWRNHLVNEHLEILKSYGFDQYLEGFGYDKIQYIKISEYTPYQQKVNEYIQKGEVFNDFEDKDLFTFAFNKSNFRSSKYDFVKYASDKGIEIERSSIKDEPLLRGLIDELEPVFAEIYLSIAELCKEKGL